MRWFSLPSMAILASIWQLLMLPSIFGQKINAECDFYQYLVVDKEYYIYNQNYPNPYGPNTACRWEAEGPPNTNIILTCEDINLPYTSNCQGDRLAISLTGNSQLTDARTYCGRGNLSLITEQNTLAVGLFSTYYSQGGSFSCKLVAKTIGPPPDMCNCGWKQGNRIIGGHETGINEFPSMSAILEGSTRDLLCGASIISPFYALTAAHCLLHRVPSELGLLVGDHNISSGADTSAAALYVLSQFISHPLYDQPTQHNDIAVIRTKLEIVFSVFVGPICLPFNYANFDFYQATVLALGWGFTDYSGPKSDVLQEVALDIVSNNYCNQQLPNDTVVNTQICSYAPGKDACLSDSGGPLLWQDQNTKKLQLVGIISYGVGCASSLPAVNTRVTSYLDWIVSVTQNTSFCVK